MKKIIIIVFLVIFIVTNIYSSVVSDIDKEQIFNKMIILIKAVNDADIESIQNLLSKNSSLKLSQNIQDNIAGQNIVYKQNIGNFQKIDKNKIRITGSFYAKGLNWNISGLSNYFVFEKIDQDWYLLESNFAQKLTAKYIFDMIINIFILILLFSLASLLIIFWLLMIIDILKRSFENKNKWLIIVILFNFLGAFIYFFTIYKNKKK